MILKVYAFVCCFMAACINAYIGEMLTSACMFLTALIWLFMILDDMDRRKPA